MGKEKVVVSLIVSPEGYPIHFEHIEPCRVGTECDVNLLCDGWIFSCWKWIIWNSLVERILQVVSLFTDII